MTNVDTKLASAHRREMQLFAVLLLSCVVGACAVDPLPLEGAWEIEWACEVGCDARPGLTLTTAALVHERSITWSTDGVGAVEHFAVQPTPECVDVPAGAEGTLGRATYHLCVIDDELTGRLAWTSYETGESTRWTVRGWR